ncbi:MAG: sensor domain-containing diguanylate cyclase [Candidatus Omnitrophica bacterium]|nr:sensor domain-containing diguanylate cyclase [Candidatus Omnitrophota bacterium]
MDNGAVLKKNLFIVIIFLIQITGFSFLLIFFQNHSLHFPFLVLLVFSASSLVLIRLELGLVLYVIEMILVLVFLAALRYPGFFLVNFIITFLCLGVITTLIKLHRQRHLNSLKLQVESVEEKVNLSNLDYFELVKINEALEKKIHRFTDLRKFSEDIIANLDLAELLNIISAKSLEIISKGDLALIYLFDGKNDVFNLASSYTLSSKIRIKAKTGDPCESWVFRQRTPLLINDVLRDFRFDSEEIFSYGRKFRSLISAPIISRDKLLGILRIDSAAADEFGVDDLRLLDIIAALSAIAVDNAFLFQKTEELAIQDSLTKFYLRREFLSLLEKRFKDKPQDGFALLMIDIDNFKKCNDTYGHITGDLVLKNISYIIKAHLGKNEYACRYGGEEFLIFLDGSSQQDLKDRSDAIRRNIESSEIKIRRNKVNVTVTVGAAFFPQDGLNIDSLIEISDARLYRGKRSGKNRVVYE